MLLNQPKEKKKTTKAYKISKTKKVVNRYLNPILQQIETYVSAGDVDFKSQLQREASLLEAVQSDIGDMLDNLLPDDPAV